MCGGRLGGHGGDEAAVHNTPTGTICARCADAEEGETCWWG